MLKLLLGGSGSGKTTLLYQRIRARAEAGEKSILLVPEQFTSSTEGRIHRELGFTVNIGIAPNRLLAKMASDFEKPDKVHTLFAHEIPQKLWPLPVRELFMLGPATERRLNRIGIHTIGELVAHTEQDLLDIRNFGMKSIDEVKEKLQSLGLALKASPLGNFDTNNLEGGTFFSPEDE